MDLLNAENSLERLLHDTKNGETVATRGFHVPLLLEVYEFTHHRSWKAHAQWIQSSVTSFFFTILAVKSSVKIEKSISKVLVLQAFSFSFRFVSFFFITGFFIYYSFLLYTTTGLLWRLFSVVGCRRIYHHYCCYGWQRIVW